MCATAPCEHVRWTSLHRTRKSRCRYDCNEAQRSAAQGRNPSKTTIIRPHRGGDDGRHPEPRASPPSPQRFPGLPTRLPDARRRPCGGDRRVAAIGRWLLDVLVVAIAYGGCIHPPHPATIDVPRDLRRMRRGSSGARWHCHVSSGAIRSQRERGIIGWRSVRGLSVSPRSAATAQGPPPLRRPSGVAPRR